MNSLVRNIPLKKFVPKFVFTRGLSTSPPRLLFTEFEENYVSVNDFDIFIHKPSDKIVIIYFPSIWTQPSEKMDLILREAENKFDDIDVVKVVTNTKHTQEVHDVLPLYDDGIPLCLFFKNSRFRYHHAGDFDKDFLENAIQLLKLSAIKDPSKIELC